MGHTTLGIRTRFRRYVQQLNSAVGKKKREIYLNATVGATARAGWQIVCRQNVYGQPLEDSTPAVGGKILHMADRSIRTALPLCGTNHLGIRNIFRLM